MPCTGSNHAPKFTVVSIWFTDKSATLEKVLKGAQTLEANLSATQLSFRAHYRESALHSGSDHLGQHHHY